MSTVTPYWTLLPPLALRGTGTSVVESLAHYMVRISHDTGLNGNEISRLSRTALFNRTGRGASTSQLCAPSSNLEDRIAAFEELTGQDTLRCGTLWVLKDVLGKSAFGRPTYWRRWCPTCYATWDTDTSYEPLIWSVEILSRCPVHQCVLDSHCADCGAKQNTHRRLEWRRFCARCKQPLGYIAPPRPLSGFRQWVDCQIEAVIALCATPNQPSLLEDTYPVYLRGLMEQAKKQGSLPAILERQIQNLQKFGRIMRPSLRTLINMCALQCVDCRTMLQSPREASSTPLIDSWSDYSALEFGSGHFGHSMDVVCWILRRLLARDNYLPSMEHALKECELSRAAVQQHHIELYDRYQLRYEGQAGPTMTDRMDHAFKMAMTHIKSLAPARRSTRYQWALPSHIAANAHIEVTDAERAFRAAISFVSIIEQAARRSRSGRLHATEDPAWLKNAPTHPMLDNIPDMNDVDPAVGIAS